MLDKQDLNGVRTAQDIEQKYNLGAINTIIKTLKDNEQVLESLGLDLSTLNEALEETNEELAETKSDLVDTNTELTSAKQDIATAQADIATAQGDINDLDEDLQIAKGDISSTNTLLNTFISTTNSTISDLQNEIDGSITTFFHADEPTMNNYPVNTWQSSDYSKHIGDLYYDTETGYAYRFYYDNNVYGWSIIRDTGVAQALAIANSAKDTADGKRRVFLEEPTPPYDCGDLWVNDGELYVCQIARESGQSYQSGDFISDFIYTDDTYARGVEDELNNSIEVERGRITRIEQSNTEYRITLEETIDSIQNDIDENRETINSMSYSFGTDDLQIAKSDDPVNMKLNNAGVKIYNYSTLMAIFNKNGSGIKKLITTESIQLQNLMLKKRQIKINNVDTDVISGFWLVNLIQDISDLEVQ